MTKNEKVYSDYVKHLSNIVSGGFVLAGFTLTTARAQEFHKTRVRILGIELKRKRNTEINS